jgi:hypothetical protein
VEDIDVITDNSNLSDFNLAKVRWKVDEESGSVMLSNVTTDLESDLIGGLFECDLNQANAVPNDKNTFLNLMLTNTPVEVDVSVA